MMMLDGGTPKDSAFASETIERDSPPIYYDQDGLIVHRGLDGGDTAQREGWYWLGVWIREHLLNNPWPTSRKLSFSQVLRLLEPAGDGVFYRHPKLPPWNNPYDKEYGFSRDQMTPLVAAMGVWGFTTELRRLWNALPQDVVGGTKHTFNGEWKTVLGHRTVFTGDIVGPATINLFRRAWSEDPMTAGDGNGPRGEDELAANVALRIHFAATNRDDTGDDLNLIAMLLMSTLRFKTTVSAQALTLYATTRPDSYGSYLGAYRQKYGVDMSASPVQVRTRMDAGIAAGWPKDASPAYGAVRWYHRIESGANPKLAEQLYAPVVAADILSDFLNLASAHMMRQSTKKKTGETVRRRDFIATSGAALGASLLRPAEAFSRGLWSKTCQRLATDTPSRPLRQPIAACLWTIYIR